MRLSIIIFVGAVRSCLAGSIVKSSRGDASSCLIEAAVSTLKTCYGNRLNAVCLAGDLDGTLISALFQQSVPVALLDDTRRVSVNGLVVEKFQYQLQVFVVAVSSPIKVKEALNEVKDSVWWNHLGFFIILNWPSVSADECSNAYEVLWAAWEANVLNVNFVCHHRANGRLMYSFNPYTGRAPDPWMLQKTYRGENDHPWSLFVRRLSDSNRSCEELNFDKTNDLGGYEVRSTVKFVPDMAIVDLSKPGIDGFSSMVGNLAKIFCGALNATCRLLLHNQSSTLDNNRAIMLDLLNGISDIGLNPRYRLSITNVKTTYPHWLSGLGVLTQYTGFESQLSKINSAIDDTSRYGVYAVFIITLLFFKYFLGQAITRAFLNTLRVACNGCILKVPRNQSSRIYLASLFVFALTIQAIYQGQLASLLTESVSLNNINTMQDLANSDHKIYGYKMFEKFFTDSAFEGRYVKTENYDCSGAVVRDSSVACVGERQILINVSLTHNLHLSNSFIVRDYWTHPIRQDWPLEERVNVILKRLAAADLINYWYMKDVQKTIDRIEYYDKLKEIRKYQAITLNQLSFAFVILGLGLAFGTTVFVIEVGLIRARLGMVNVVTHVRGQLRVQNK